MLTVNRAAVEAEVTRRRVIRELGFGRWLVARLAMNLAAFYAVAWVVRWASPDSSIARLSGWGLTVFLAVPAFMALFVTAVAERMMFSDAMLDAERVAARISREVDSLTGRGWPLRTLRAALVLALGAGIPLAVIVFVTKRPATLARASDAAIIVFVSSVLVFAIAMAFAIRAATLYVYRDLLMEATAHES